MAKVLRKCYNPVGNRQGRQRSSPDWAEILTNEEKQSNMLYDQQYRI